MHTYAAIRSLLMIRYHTIVRSVIIHSFSHMRYIFTITVLIATIHMFSWFVHAEESISPTPAGQRWRDEAQELREEIKEEREDLKQEIEDEKEDLIRENKTEREELRQNTREMLDGKTREERKELRPTIVQSRKDLIASNAAERKELRISIFERISAFRQTISERWRNLWSSIFGSR